MLESLKHEDLQFQELSPEEKQSRGILARLSGPIASFTKGTRNGRKYSDKLWEKAFDSPLVKEMFKNGGLPGELQHPENRSETDPTKIAIMMPEPPKKDSNGHLVASVDILDTPCGQIAYQLGKYGFKFGISSRGEGDLITDFSGEESVDPDTYTLNAFDLVLIPACEDARLQFNESLNAKKSNKLRTILSEALDNASDTDRKIMEDALDELDIDDNWRFIETYQDTDIYYDPSRKKYIVGYSDDFTILNSLKNAKEYIDRYNPEGEFFKESLLKEEQVGREETKDSEKPSDILQNNKEKQSKSDEDKSEEEKDDPNKASWDTDFHRLDVAYNHNFKQFDDMEEDREALKDFTDDLDGQHKKYTIYKHESDPGCTVFFKESLNESHEDDIKYIDVETINPNKKDIDRAEGLQYRGKTFRGNGKPFGSEASKMAKLIKDPIKLVRRSKAVVSRYGTDDADKDTDVWGPFKRRLIEFGFTPEQISKISNFKLNESLNEDISWEELNGTEQSAVEAALAELKNGSTIEDAVHGAVEMYNNANEDEEYEDEYFFMEEADYTKVLDYVKSHEGTSLTEGGYGSTVKLSAPFDQGWEFTLDCGKEYIDFDSLDELISELKYRGLPLSLAEFDRNRYSSENGYIENHYQSYATYAYPPDTLGDWYDDYDEAVRNRVIESKCEELTEDKYTRDELFDKFGTDNLDIINAGNEETVELKEGSIPDFAKILDSGYCNKDEWPEVKKEQLNKYKKDYKNVKCTLQKSDTKGLRMWITYTNDAELAADDNGAIVEQLQNILKQNKSLEEKVKTLQEKLSVGYAKEMELKEELDTYKQRVSKLSNKTKEIKVLTEKLSKAEQKIKDSSAQAEGKISTLNESISNKDFENKDLRKDISALNETLGKKDSLIKSLDEQLGKAKEKLCSKQDDIEQLKEKYETGQKDLEQLKTQYANKIEQQNQIIEKYQRVAKNSVKRYIESQAVRLGVKSDEIVNRLPKNYSFNDIDTICEDLQEYKFNMSNLPFSQYGLNENLKVTAKNVSKGLVEANPDDEITEYDLKIAEAYI